jgi:hypothetical protein
MTELGELIAEALKRKQGAEPHGGNLQVANAGAAKRKR